MKKPVIPLNEFDRLTALQKLKILDTSAESCFDDLTMLAAAICDVPIALISLVDSDRQWFKSKIGIDAESTPRDLAFCAHAINEDKVFLVPDARVDERFADNPLVTGDTDIKFYAGAPLFDDQGHGLGTICVIDNVPRNLKPGQIDALAALSRQVVAQFKLRNEIVELEVSHRENMQQKELLRSFFDSISMMMGVVELRENEIHFIADNNATSKFMETTGVPTISKMQTDILNLWISSYKKSEALGRPVEFIYQQDSVAGLHWIKASVNYLHTNSAGVPRYSFVAEDVTERLLLESKVKEQQKDLIQSSKMASLGEMAAGIAHEINSPLAVISSRANLKRFGYKRPYRSKATLKFIR